MSTDSRLLFEALAGVFTGLGFDVLDDDVFTDLVIARIVGADFAARHRPRAA